MLFKTLINEGDNDARLVPILAGYLQRGDLPNPFVAKVRGGSGDVGPDDYFHPSGHPLMDDRQLYLYLTQPDAWMREPLGYIGRMSTLMGSVTHEIVETALTDCGYLVKPKGTCVACGKQQPKQCREHGAIDLELGSRGHMDGLLRYDDQDHGFEFKTAIPFSLKDVRNNDIELFRTKWPKYYAQVQEYMRMTSLTKYVVIFMAMGNPWTLKEFHIDYDPFHAGQVAAKYFRVREFIKRGIMPDPCCSPGSSQSKICPATSCPVKKLMK
jgi:hypothetical protein